MVRNITAGVLLLLLACGWILAADQTKKLSAEELEQMIQDEKNLFLLDVREPKELAELGALKGYVNIPLSELDKRTNEVPKDKVVVTICNRAVRATTAAEILAKHGFTNVIGACAMNEWKEKKKPVIYPKAEEKK